MKQSSQNNQGDNTYCANCNSSPATHTCECPHSDTKVAIYCSYCGNRLDAEKTAVSKTQLNSGLYNLTELIAAAKHHAQTSPGDTGKNQKINQSDIEQLFTGKINHGNDGSNS